MPLIKNDQSGNQNIKIIKHGEITAEDPINICNRFNNFFTSLSSTSNVDLDECIDFFKNHFDNIIEVSLISHCSYITQKL